MLPYTILLTILIIFFIWYTEENDSTKLLINKRHSIGISIFASILTSMAVKKLMDKPYSETVNYIDSTLISSIIAAIVSVQVVDLFIKDK